MEKYLGTGNNSIQQEEVERLIDAHTAPGCSIAVASPTEMQSFSVGHYDGADGPEVSPRTVYDVASVSKLFTAALALRLHEKGALSINDRCANYLENFQQSDITLVDLLAHKVDFNVMLSKYRAIYTDEAGLRNALMGIQPPSHPSKGVFYGNLEFIYLGKIIEDVTQRDLQSNMRALFQDLGLSETYTGPDVTRLDIKTPPTEVVDGMAVQGVTHDETARTLGGLAGNAGIFTTAEDLVKFGTAWLDGKIVHTEELRHATFRDYDQSGTRPQAIGWWMRYPAPGGERATPGIFSHTGYTGSMLLINPDNGKVGAMTCNRTYYGRDNANQRQIWERLVNWAQV